MNPSVIKIFIGAGVVLLCIAIVIVKRLLRRPGNYSGKNIIPWMYSERHKTWISHPKDSIPKKKRSGNQILDNKVW